MLSKVLLNKCCSTPPATDQRVLCSDKYRMCVTSFTITLYLIRSHGSEANHPLQRHMAIRSCSLMYSAAGNVIGSCAYTACDALMTAHG